MKYIYVLICFIPVFLSATSSKMSSYDYRKCAKCGKTRAEDKVVTYHRFTDPGKNNITKALAWAKYCWPDEEWKHETLVKLNTSSKVLCGRHFASSEFYDDKRQKLTRFAVPDAADVEELLKKRDNVFKENITQSAEQHMLRMPFAQIKNVEPSTSAVVQTLKPTAMENVQEKENISKQNITLSAEQHMLRMPFAQIENVEPSTSAVVQTLKPTAMDIVQEKENISKQNITLSAEQHMLRMPFAQIENVEPSTSAVVQTLKPTAMDIVQEKENISKQATRAKRKCSSILGAIDATRLNTLTAREKKLYKVCRQKLTEVIRLRNKLKHRKVDVTKQLLDSENVKKLCNLKISNSFIVLLQSQLKNCPKKPKGRRYSLNQKIMSLVIYKKSPACYRLLRRMFALPSQSSLNKLLNKIPLKPGINKHVFSSLRKMSCRQSDDNVCILSFDEMSIRKHLFYDSKQDIIQGFQDHGDHGRNDQIASKALVFMLAGIRKKWKQPIAFYFSSTINADRMTVITKQVLTECFNAGLNVVATVCDLSTVNIKVLKTLGATTRDPYFVHSGREIVALLDPPHLLKCTRNMFMKHDVEFITDIQGNDKRVKGTAKWSHIETFYNLDKNNLNFVYAPSLTEHHLKPNVKQQMRVKLAAQVFSHSVTGGLLAKIASNELPPEAHATATLTQNFDELFDAVNADSPDLRRGKKYSTNLTSKSPHITLFDKMRKFIAEMKYLGSKSTPPSQDGWIHTMNAIQRLWQNLKLIGITSLPTHRLNQDPLENFFGCIRYSCGCNSNPTMQQFGAGVKTAILSNLRHSGQRKNCEDDTAILCDNMSRFLTEICNEEKETHDYSNFNNVEALLADSIEAVEEATPEGQACAYVCGFIYKNLRHNDCLDCRKSFLSDTIETIHVFTSFREYNANNALNYANKAFIQCVETMATLIHQYLKENAWREKIQNNIITELDIVDVSYLNNCNKHLEMNKKHIKNSTFYICVKRFTLLKTEKWMKRRKKKALDRKIRILRNK